MTKLIRQGDVLLKRVEFLPSDAKEEVQDGVLARGETTGHSHRIEGARVLRRSSGQMLVQVEQEARLVHEEHGTQRLEKGIYEVVIQREYSPIENRRVSD